MKVEHQLQTTLKGRAYPFALIAGPGPFVAGHLIGYGHQDIAAFEKATLKYLDVTHPDEPIIVEWVEHDYGVHIGPGPLDISWEGITDKTAGSFPITRLSIEISVRAR